MNSTRAELQLNREATVLLHHLKHRHKNCTVRWSNIKIYPSVEGTPKAGELQGEDVQF